MSRPKPVEVRIREFRGLHRHSHIFRIDNFSLFEKYNLKEIESSVFTIGFEKRKLVVYPNGNESDNGRDHVSLYLETQVAGSRPLPSTWSRSIRYQLFVLNQFRQDWRVKDGRVTFNASNRKRGFSRLISIAEFRNPRNGYLVDGCSLFGVKIFDVPGNIKSGTTDCLSLIEKPLNNKFSWKMMKLSTLDQYTEYRSDEFIIENRKWKISVYPQGTRQNVDMLAVYLQGEDFISNTRKVNTYVQYKLRVLDQKNSNHVTKSYSYWFPVYPYGWGTDAFMPLKDLRNPSNYVVNDTLYVEVEVDVISISN